MPTPPRHPRHMPRHMLALLPLLLLANCTASGSAIGSISYKGNRGESIHMTVEQPLKQMSSLCAKLLKDGMGAPIEKRREKETRITLTAELADATLTVDCRQLTPDHTFVEFTAASDSAAYNDAAADVFQELLQETVDRDGKEDDDGEEAGDDNLSN